MTREQQAAAFALRLDDALRALVLDREEQARSLGAFADALTAVADHHHFDHAALLHRLYLEWFGPPKGDG